MAKKRQSQFNRRPFFTADRDLIEALIRQAKTSPSRSFRYCLHESPQAPVQEMIVASCVEATRPPHCHPHSAETHVMIQGEIMVVLFNGCGRIIRRVELGPPEGKKPFSVRIAAGRWHMVVFRSEPAVYFEVAQGPFVRDKTTVWADWAPSADDPQAVAQYCRKLGLA